MRGKTEELPNNEVSSTIAQTPTSSNPYVQMQNITNASVSQQIPEASNRNIQNPPPSYNEATYAPEKNVRTQQPQVQVVGSNVPLSSRMQQGAFFPPGYERSRHPVNTLCPVCGEQITTRVETYSSIITIIIAVILFLLACILVIIPFLCTRCKRTTHYCPKCGAVLGKVREFQ